MKMTYKIKGYKKVTVPIPTPVDMTTLEEIWFENQLTGLGTPDEDDQETEGTSDEDDQETEGTPDENDEEIEGIPHESVLEIHDLPESLTSIGNNAFYHCNELTAITLPESLTSIGHCAFGWCGKLTAITLPESLKHIGNKAFGDCSAWESGYILAPESLEIDIERVGIPATTKIIRYDASTHANPIAAVHALYERIITECDYTDPEKKKQVQKHLEESFLKPEQLLKSALEWLSQLSTIKGRIEVTEPIIAFLKEGCQILKGDIPSRELDLESAQKALIELTTPRSSGSRLTDSLSRTTPHILSLEIAILMAPKPDIYSIWADLTSVASEEDSPDQNCGGGGGGSKPAQ
jgi:hypothetical protein